MRAFLRLSSSLLSRPMTSSHCPTSSSSSSYNEMITGLRTSTACRRTYLSRHRQTTSKWCLRKLPSMIAPIDVAGHKRVACQIQPINLHDQVQYERLQAQRRECGWYYEDAYLNRWREAAVEGAKCLFWITTSSSDDTDQPFVFAGHISLDSFSESADLQREMTRSDKSLLTISTFFVLPEFRGKGVGGHAWTQLERLAKVEPYGNLRCSDIVIMSLSCRYVEDPVLRARYVEWTGEEPLSYERWYSRMGYVKWKEEACTEVATSGGEIVLLVEAFMMKSLSETVGRDL